MVEDTTMRSGEAGFQRGNVWTGTRKRASQVGSVSVGDVIAGGYPAAGHTRTGQSSAPNTNAALSPPNPNEVDRIRR